MINVADANDTYIHNICGSTVTGTRERLRILPKALVQTNNAITIDFIDFGALIYAYSIPVIAAKISAMPNRK
jgi:hypothetical protein